MFRAARKEIRAGMVRQLNTKSARARISARAQIFHAGENQAVTREICLDSLPAGRQGPAKNEISVDLARIYVIINGSYDKYK